VSRFELSGLMRSNPGERAGKGLEDCAERPHLPQLCGSNWNDTDQLERQLEQLGVHVLKELPPEKAIDSAGDKKSQLRRLGR
jgi:hypothetical protein